MTSEPLTPPEVSAVPRYARTDAIGGALMLLVAGLLWYGAIELDVGRIVNIGPGALPRGLAFLLALAGAALLFRGLAGRGDGAERLMLVLRPPLVLFTAIVLFALFIRGGDFRIVSTPRLGLMVVAPLTVFIAGFATPEARWRELLVMAFGLSAAMILLFCDLLAVPLPVFPDAVEAAIPPSLGADAAARGLYLAYAGLAALLAVLFFGLPGARRG